MIVLPVMITDSRGPAQFVPRNTVVERIAPHSSLSVGYHRCRVGGDRIVAGLSGPRWLRRVRSSKMCESGQTEEICQVKTTVLSPLSSTRCWQCQRTALERASDSASRPTFDSARGSYV